MHDLDFCSELIMAGKKFSVCVFQLPKFVFIVFVGKAEI